MKINSLEKFKNESGNFHAAHVVEDALFDLSKLPSVKINPAPGHGRELLVATTDGVKVARVGDWVVYPQNGHPVIESAGEFKAKYFHVPAVVNKYNLESIESACRPLIKFLNDNPGMFNPHSSIRIHTSGFEVSEGCAGMSIPDYIKD